MNIIHKFNKKEVSGEGSDNFLLSSNSGGFLGVGSSSFSQYLGWFHFLEDEWNLFKSIEHIGLRGSPEKIINHGNYFERITGNSVETFILNNDTTFTYVVRNYEGLINVFLDFRRVHDFDDSGKVYDFYFEKGCLVVEYKKYYDNSLRDLREIKFLVLKGNFEFVKRNEWIKRNYNFDAQRNTKSEFYVNYGFDLDVDCKGDSFFVFSFNSNKEVALSDCFRAYYSNVEGHRVKDINSEDVNLDIVKIANHNLLTHFSKDNSYGIFAGLPWFFQIWSRDELISCVGLLIEKNYWLLKEILLNNWNNVLDNGFLANRRPHSDLGSADGIGWLYKRTLNFILHLEDEELLRDYFDDEELIFIYVKLLNSISKIRESNFREGLFFNHGLETWMDTHGNTGDVRDGFRVEIQALHFKGLELAEKLSVMLGVDESKYSIMKKELIFAVNKNLVFEDILLDGIYFDFSPDWTARPNIFLAYYIAPEIVSNSIWKKTFDFVLENCWLNWGGLSSISKRSSLFCNRHTGMTNDSYHRGDSWYYVNNIAAISLNKFSSIIGNNTYQQFIDKIKAASIREMLFSGFIGQCAELSDAAENNSKGCLCQAWSAATLLELLSFLKN
ncbi:hypothetical protein K9L97_03550 [Candidatus Woesearchaeota archaeon]|nr:hypothetical protein [Candidatus Woesearchaeota archaeon]